MSLPFVFSVCPEERPTLSVSHHFLTAAFSSENSCFLFSQVLATTSGAARIESVKLNVTD